MRSCLLELKWVISHLLVWRCCFATWLPVLPQYIPMLGNWLDHHVFHPEVSLDCFALFSFSPTPVLCMASSYPDPKLQGSSKSKLREVSGKQGQGLWRLWWVGSRERVVSQGMQQALGGLGRWTQVFVRPPRASPTLEAPYALFNDLCSYLTIVSVYSIIILL